MKTNDSNGPTKTVIPRLATEAELRIVLGPRIKAARKRLGLSQHALIALAGIQQSTLSMVENGKVLPCRFMVDRVAAALGISLFELLKAP